MSLSSESESLSSRSIHSLNLTNKATAQIPIGPKTPQSNWTHIFF